MAKKKKPNHYWNHRIIARWCKGLPGSEGCWLFSIAEVHYDHGKPTGSGDKNMLQGHSSIEELEWVRKRLKKAFKKPILNGDNHLKKWKG